MREDVSTDLTRSARDFLRWVWPVIAPSLGGGDIYPVEFTERGAGPHRDLFPFARHHDGQGVVLFALRICDGDEADFFNGVVVRHVLSRSDWRFRCAPCKA